MSKLIKELRELAASEEVADRAADELERIIALDSESKLEDRDETIKILEREVAQQGFYNEELRKQCDTLEFRIAALQANLDAVMLEYCPGEMTPEQIAEWGKHQVQSTEPVAEMKDLNTMLVMNAEIASLKQQLAEEQRENEELRRSWGAQCESADKLFDELAALKSQSAPASVWLWRNKTTFCFFATKELAMQMNSGGLSTWVEPVEVPVIGNTTPPQATALLENLGDWVYERMQQADSDYNNHGDDTAEVYATLKMVLSKIESMIESLPLIQGEK